MAVEITLRNSMTRRKERFVPIDPDNVRIYLCGPTVYDRAHLGNARNVIMFDVLFRLLREVYGAEHVTYVRNFTDVDDKINARAAETGRPISEITEETTRWYLEDMAALGTLEPTHMPRATAYIDEMIEMIKILIKKGYAYQKSISFGHNSRAVYFNAKKAPEHAFFDVDKDSSYGEFSNRSLEEMRAGARAEVGEGKDDPMDFVLWKPSTVDEPGWDSPWGLGRPGWHIECSAMSKALLGDTFDIHGGGIDLQFPHHENEIAQSCCANGTNKMANIWLHNEMLQVEGRKMSKSLGNFFTVRDLLDRGVPGEVIRFVFLSTHYSKPMDWTEKKAQEAEKTLRKWRSLANSAGADGEINSDVLKAVCDDLNTPGAIAELHRLAKGIQVRHRDEVTQSEIDSFAASARFVGLLQDNAAMGSWVFDGAVEKLEQDVLLDSLANSLFEARRSAMESKDFSKVDAMKATLVEAGVEVRMSKAGVELVPGAGFDPSKLESL